MKKIALFFLIAFPFFIHAQDQKTTSLAYKPPSTTNGPTRVDVNLNYRILNAFGTIMIYYNTECTNNLAYQYKGREFTFTGIDVAVRKVRSYAPQIRVRIDGPDGFQKVMTLWATSATGGIGGNSDEIRDAKTKEQKDPANYTLTAIQVTSVMFEDNEEVTSLIEERLKQDAVAAKIVSFLTAGDLALDQKNLEEATKNFEQVTKLDPANERAKMKLGQIEKLQKNKDVQKRYDDLMDAAKSEEESGNLEEAEKLFRQAAKENVTSNAAQNQASRVHDSLERKRKDLEDKIKATKEKAEKEQKALAEANEKQTAETQKALQKKEKLAEEFQRKQLDSVAESLRDEDRRKMEKDIEQSFKDKQDREKKAEDAEEKADKNKKLMRQAQDEIVISRIETYMQYDPEQYDRALAAAENKLTATLAINPSSELELKKEWWDNNSYIQYYADELYENQRRENHNAYMKKLTEVEYGFRDSKEAFLTAMHYVDKGSDEQKYLIKRINFCNDDIDFQEKYWKISNKGETSRIQRREDARAMANVDRQIDNRMRAESAYMVLNRNPENPAEHLMDSYNLSQRMEVAHAQYEQDMAVAGVSQSLAMSTILDDSKKTDSSKNYMFNATVSLEYNAVPLIVNETSNVNASRSKVGTLSAAILNVGMDLWYYRNKYVDVGLGLDGGYGVWPAEGEKTSYYHYNARINTDVGYRYFKLATVAQYLGRGGDYEYDYDVANAGNGSGASGAIDKGSFDYGVFRLGAGLKIDFSDGEYQFVQFLVFAEQPSFYKPSIFSKPIYSYQFEACVGSGIYFNIEYADKYVIAGKNDFPIEDAKDKSYWRFQMGKTWTIF